MTRRAEDLAVILGDIPPRVPYRHVVTTFPRLMGIRHRVREDPTLLRRLVRLSVGVVTRELRRETRSHRHRREELAAALPGVMAAWQSAGDSLQDHPHGHVLLTDGVFLPSGEFYGDPNWDSKRLTALLRDSVLASFTRLGLLSPEAAETMKSWPVERSGFHVHAETRVDPDDRERLRTLLKDLTRSPIALNRLHDSEQTGQVACRTKMGATLHTLARGRTGRVDLSPTLLRAERGSVGSSRGRPSRSGAVDFLCDLSQHIPPRGRLFLSHHGWLASALGRLEPPPSHPKTSPRDPDHAQIGRR